MHHAESLGLIIRPNNLRRTSDISKDNNLAVRFEK